MEAHSIHKLEIEGIGGHIIRFADYIGKKILIVNVASECGFTVQYAQLQELYETFNDRLVIIACPCNDFGGQEPGNLATIKTFCERNYGVTFPITRKVNITKTPTDKLYQWLTQKMLNGLKDSEVRWNFHKYLLDENGQLIDQYPSATSPFDDGILAHISS